MRCGKRFFRPRASPSPPPSSWRRISPFRASTPHHYCGKNVEQKRALGNLRQLILRLQKLADDDEAILLIEGNDLKAGKLSQVPTLPFSLPAQGQTTDAAPQCAVEFGGELLEGWRPAGSSLPLAAFGAPSPEGSVLFQLHQLLEELTRFGRASSNDIARLAECARRIEPEREETYRAVMAAYARIGNISACDNIHELLLDQLRQEGRAPEAETVALRRRIQSLTATITAHCGRGNREACKIRHQTAGRFRPPRKGRRSTGFSRHAGLCRGCR